MKKLITSTCSYCFAQKMILVLVLSLSVSQIFAQCTGCSSTITNNSSAITINSGQVVCLTYAGTFTKTITFNGGTLCISSATTVSSAITVNSGCTLNVLGKVTGAVTQNGGTITVNSGATFSPSSMAFNGGTFTNNGTTTFGYAVSVSSTVTLTSTSTFTASGLTNNGGSVALSGTTTINGSLTNNNSGGVLSITGPSANVTGSFAANGGTTNFAGGISISGSVNNYASINLSGALNIAGNYTTSSGSLTANASGCNSMTVGGTITTYTGGTYNGNGYSLAISPSAGCTTCMSGGAYSAPTQQPTSLSLSISGSSVSGSFTSPSSSIGGYIVIRYVGTSVPSDNPANSSSYTVGSTIGSSTVVAIISSSTTGTKTFTDNLPSASCGKNAYYRIFSYNGSGTCSLFDITSPLTGSIAVSNASATISASGATTFCTPGSVTLSASSGSSYSWNTGATTSSISVSSSNTYTVTVTTASGCTATASQTVTANTVSAITPYMIANNNGWQSISSATVCAGSFVEFGPQPTSGTWTWTGPSGFHSFQRDTAISAIAAAQGGTYTATYVDGNGCTNSMAFTVNVNSVAAAVTNQTVCGGSATLTASGGGTYQWNTGATSASISTSSTGTYYVTVTGTNGCSASASGNATVNSIPVVTVSVTGACAGSSSVLTASGGNSYLWSTGATTASISSTSTANYTVTATSANGCTAAASASSLIYPAPTLSITSNTPVCVGSNINLSATASGSTTYTYNWSGVSSFSANTSSASVSNANTANSGSYNLTVTDNHNCTVSASATVFVDPNCNDSTTVGANGGGSSDAPCTQILRFDHYNDIVASQPGGQNHKWILYNGNVLSMTITRVAGGFTSVTAPTWSGAAFGQSGYTGLNGKTVLYTSNGGYSKLVFSNIQMKDSLGNIIPNFTLIGIDGESTDNAERDTLTSNGTSWFDYDTITPPSVGSVPSETGVGTNMLIWAGTGPVNARARLVSTNNPTNFTFSTVAGGLQGFAMGVSNPIKAPTALTICSKSSFNATPTNLPAGTTYVWSAPVVTPAGSVTGATAQSTPVSVVGQTLVNTTSSPATVVYNVIPSNNCSGLGYTVTVTVNPAPVATITSNSPQCVGNTVTVTASPVSGGPLTYSWSGPNSFTAAANTFSIANTTTATSGTYTVTITGSNTCTASVSASVSVVNCLSVSGYVFDDANGNGTIDATETKTSFGQTIYSVVADTNGLVVSTASVAADGSFTVNNILPSTAGMTVRISSTNPSVGSAVPAASWPANWLGTLGQYGTNNAAGTGVFNNASELIPLKTGTLNITNMYIGFDRLAAPASQFYTIAHPARNSVKALTTAAGLGNITWADPEDAANTGSFVVRSITGMNNNTLFYDSNNNNLAESAEIISGYRVINGFNPAKLKVKFTGLGSSTATFNYGYIDAAGKSNPTPSSYMLSWAGALPVKLISFDATVNKENTVDLNWATASELDNAYFEVERSSDAVDFSPIAKVEGAGNSTNTIQYHTTDNNPLNGMSYYRLKQVDLDGNFAYSEIVSVSISGGALNQSSVRVYPTLISSPSIHIAVSGTDVPVAVSVYDMSGRMVMTQLITANGDTQIELPAGAQTGMYIVNCNTGQSTTSTKIVYSSR